MKLIAKNRSRAIMGGCAAAISLVALAGCQGHKVVARVNSVPINEEDFTARALRVKGGQLAQDPNLEAGEATLVAMVREELLQQCAKANKVNVSDTDVKAMEDLSKSLDSSLRSALAAGRMSEDDVARQTRMSLEQLGIGVNGAKASDAEVQQMYTKIGPKLNIQETWTTHLLQVPDEIRGREALGLIRMGRSFPEAAQALGMPPQQAQASATETPLKVDEVKKLYPPLYAALINLKPGQTASQPIALTMKGPNGKPILVYTVVQLVADNPAFTPTLAQARPLLERVALTQKFPEWQYHAMTTIQDFTRKASIQIDEDRYKPLLAKYINPPQTQPTMPGGMPPIRRSQGGAGAPGAAPAPRSEPGAPQSATPGQP